MAPVVIDLTAISVESDDEVPTAARHTLDLFKPRKEKDSAPCDGVEADPQDGRIDRASNSIGMGRQLRFHTTREASRVTEFNDTHNDGQESKPQTSWTYSLRAEKGSLADLLSRNELQSRHNRKVDTSARESSVGNHEISNSDQTIGPPGKDAHTCQAYPVWTSNSQAGRRDRVGNVSLRPFKRQKTDNETQADASASPSYGNKKPGQDKPTVDDRSSIVNGHCHEELPLVCESDCNAQRPQVELDSLTPADQLSLHVLSNHGLPYSAEEDALLIKLKEVEKLDWGKVPSYFNGRTQSSLQVHYSTKLKSRDAQRSGGRPILAKSGPSRRDSSQPSLLDGSEVPQRRRERRNVGASAVDGFISWAEIKKQRTVAGEQDAAQHDERAKPLEEAQFETQRAYGKTLSRILRQREYGTNFGRSWQYSKRTVGEETKEHVFGTVGPVQYYQGTSGDVICLAWSPNNTQFAAGSIAISDERSMQYNRPNNLVLGDRKAGVLRELPEHYVSRPQIEQLGNVNALRSMRETQDPKMFMTVTSVQFSPDGSTLYSAGTDRQARAYRIENDLERACCAYTLTHEASLDLLSVSNDGILATASHQATDGSINVFRKQNRVLSLSPSRTDAQTRRPIYPSSLRWGTSHRHRNFLLAGFSIDSVDDERALAGETCLWDITTGQRMTVHSVTHNVFDVAWNPSPTSSSTHFAVACTPGAVSVSRGTRSLVQCFAPNQGRVSRVLEWHCPAFDINDIVYCPYDDNIIAAGATDGKVYIWDQRYARRSNSPLHMLAHDDSINVLDHDRRLEIADTGVRFLSWGATSSRVYSGSSDGVVKIWNPYRSTADAHVKDAATFSSAVMSGALSPDYRDLLVGEDAGRINLLSIGHETKTVRSMRKFDFLPAVHPSKENDDNLNAARDLIKRGEIELRPVGDLPIRQAVQGPNYQGPFLRPSLAEIEKAELTLQNALRGQQSLQQKAATFVPPSSQDGEIETALKAADQRVDDARAEKLQLQARADYAAACHAKAQARLADAKSRSSALPLTESCKLDCNYLPAFVDEEVHDSRRSERRIPHVLRPSAPPLDIPEDLSIYAGLCIQCRAPAMTSFCTTCMTTKKGLTARCAQCYTPVRPLDRIADLMLCESCHFGCFRCSNPAEVLDSGRRIVCDNCNLAWSAGALGYELIRPQDLEEISSGTRAGKISQQVEKVLDELGEEEIEGFAALWG